MSTAKLRIGLLCHRGVGGSTRIAVALATELARRGHHSHLFARSAPLGIRAFSPGLSLHTLDDESESHLTASLDDAWSGDDLERLVERVVAVVETDGLDVLHFHYAVPFAWALAEVRRRLGARSPALVGTLHGTEVDVQEENVAVVLTRALAQLDVLTTVSQSQAAAAVRALRLPRPPEVIPNFVDTTRFRPRGGNTNGRVVHVSNFRPVKEPQSLARVYIELRRHRRAALWLVGDGEEMAPLEAMLEAAGVAGEVRRFGLRLDVETILPEATALLLTSRTESFSLVALEAAACGIPVVAPRVGGLPEVVAHGRTGCLFEPGDEAGAARSLARLLAEPALRDPMALAAVERAQEFDCARIVPRYELLYRQVLDGQLERPAEMRPAR